MIKTKTKNLTLWIVRILLTLACVATAAWIFSNSLKTGVESSSQSSQVTEDVKDVIETVKPDVDFGGETEEEDFNILHSYVRDFAHFAEFALFAALCTWCVRSYTERKLAFAIPVPLGVGTAFFDEYLQTFSDGRAWQLSDVATDSLGSCAGFVFALATIFLAGLVYRAIQKRKSRKET